MVSRCNPFAVLTDREVLLAVIAILASAWAVCLLLRPLVPRR